ncbi:ammonium transporter Rh type B-like [Rhopilema esculentum]|uniref:ammonium transporter Rh type B-like n=1 Tax=Rhopilema esculentum TaxID=499914 RepID=UPI0031DC9573
MSGASNGKAKFASLLLLFQGILLILFVVFVDYGDELLPSDPGRLKKVKTRELGVFQDIHLLALLGFGLILTFLKRYTKGSMVHSFLIVGVVVQWATLLQGFFKMERSKVLLTIDRMISADFAAMAILISFGAVLGIANSVQLLTIALLEALFYSINEGVCTTILYVSDNGKTFFVHVFGAVYGVVVARMLYRGRVFRNSGLLCSSYNSEVFTLIGTMFLWVYWPSFNSYGADDITRQRAMVNTFYALAASCVATFAFSVLSSSESKLHMGHIQNATLAGGVAIGSIAQMIIQPWGAVLMGLVASLISVIGYRYIQRKLERRFRIFDIRGVLAIHGFPGLLGAIASVIVTAMAKYGTYKTSLYRLYPAVTPTSNSTAYNELTQFEPDIPPGLNRSLGQQAAFQISGLFLSISVALLGGLITGKTELGGHGKSE